VPAAAKPFVPLRTSSVASLLAGLAMLELAGRAMSKA